jgi:hypothetical protein
MLSCHCMRRRAQSLAARAGAPTQLRCVVPRPCIAACGITPNSEPGPLVSATHLQTSLHVSAMVTCVSRCLICCCCVCVFSVASLRAAELWRAARTRTCARTFWPARHSKVLPHVAVKPCKVSAVAWRLCAHTGAGSTAAAHTLAQPRSGHSLQHPCSCTFASACTATMRSSAASKHSC